MKTDERQEFALVDLTAGLICCLRLDGVRWLEPSRRAEEAFVRHANVLQERVEAAGFWWSFYLGTHPLYGGSSTVREAFRSPSAQVLLQRWTNESALELSLTEDTAERILEHLPGERSWYEEFARNFRRELQP